MSNLVAYYPFSGNVNDESGNGNNGTVNGATLTTDRKGNGDRAYSFDGSNDYVDCGDSLSLTDAITVAAWVKNDDSSNGHIVNCGGGWSDKGYSMFWYDGKIRIELRNSSQTTCDNSAPSDNAWHHIAFTWEKTSGTITSYIDGEAQSTTGSFTQSIGTPSQNLNIGRNEKRGHYFYGSITEVRIYSSALSAAEISTLSEGNGLIAHYPFNGNADDESCYGNDGTVSGATLTTDRFGNADSAYNFANSSDMLLLDNPISLEGSEWTIATWFKMPLATSSGSWNTLTRGQNGDHQVIIRKSDGKLGSYESGGPGFHDSGYDVSNLSTGWHHLTAVAKDDKTNFYINGTLVGSSNFQSTTDIYAIGNYQGDGQAFGTIDDLRIYDTALSANEIKSLYRLVAHYPFDGNANDESVNKNHGTVSGATLTTDRNGNADSAYSFDGTTGDYINCGTNFSGFPSTAITVGFWMKSDETTKNCTPFSYAPSAGLNNAFLLYNIKSLDVYIYTSAIATGIAYNDGEWHHLAVTWESSSGDLKVYKDGVCEFEGTTAQGESIPSGGCLILGQEQDTVGGSFDVTQAFKGEMADVRIYNTVLSADEIKLQSCLLAYYPLNGNVNADDESGNGNNGTVNGTTLTTDRNGNADSAYSFDGSNDYVDCGDSLSLTDAITVAAWVKNDDSSNGHIVNCGGGWSDKGYSMFWYDGNIRIQLKNSSQTTCENPAPSDNAWHYIAFTWEKTSGIITSYIDGEAQDTKGSFTESIGTPTQNLNIGRNEVRGHYFYGSITEVRIYSSALSAAEIKSLYHPLLAYYPFNANANDESGNGNNATVYGATRVDNRFYKDSKAYRFDGSNDYIDAGTAINLNNSSFTISVWMKTDISTHDPSIISNKDWTSGGNKGFVIAQKGSSWKFNLGDGSNRKDLNEIGENIDDGNWHQLAVTVDLDTGYITAYQDGAIRSIMPFSGIDSDNMDGGLGIKIAQDGTGSYSDFFEGEIDDVRIYDRAFSSDDISTLYGEECVKAHYALDGNVNDTSGNSSKAMYVYSTPTLTTDRFGNADSAYEFDGVNDFIQSADISDIRAISMWVNIPDGQSSGWRYLLDARDGLDNGDVATNNCGSGWDRMYVNDVLTPLEWDNIPKGEWVNLYFETDDVCDGEIRFMASDPDEALAGTISDIRLYNRSIIITQEYPEYETNIYTISNVHSNKVMAIQFASKLNGKNINQYTSNGGNNQKWEIISVGDGYYKFESCHSEKVVEVQGNSTDNGRNIQQWEWAEGDNQIWKIIEVSDGEFKFIAKSSGKVLEVSGSSHDDNGNIQQWDWDGADNQRWKFTVTN
jgi:hypothetical protein